jgi:hypothetical protein
MKRLFRPSKSPPVSREVEIGQQGSETPGESPPPGEPQTSSAATRTASVSAGQQFAKQFKLFGGVNRRNTIQEDSGRRFIAPVDNVRQTIGEFASGSPSSAFDPLQLWNGLCANPFGPAAGGDVACTDLSTCSSPT